MCMYLYVFVDDLKKSIAKSAISIDAHSQYDKVGVSCVHGLSQLYDSMCVFTTQAVCLYERYMTGSGQDQIHFDSALIRHIYHSEL